MRFRITGADQHSGEDIDTIIEAPDKFNAERLAREGGLLISQCVAVHDLERQPQQVVASPPQPHVVYVQTPAPRYIDERPTRKRRRSVQTIEQTGKSWKALMFLSTVACIVGVSMMIASGQGMVQPNTGVLGGLLLAGGIFFFLVARIGAWWYHG